MTTGVDTVRSAFHASYMWYDGTTANVSEEQAHFQPQGKTHNIATLAAHIQQSEDWFFNQMMKGGETMWESEGWGDKLGIPNVMRMEDGVDVTMEGGLERLKPYQDAVRANTAAYFDSLTDEDLDEELDLSSLGMDPMRRVDVIMGFVLGNTFAHTGEISAVQGFQGAQGYPF